MVTRIVQLDATAVEPRLRRVVLSSAGVGQFDYSAEVSGNSSLSLKVGRDEVAGILKRLRVRDPTGQVSGVTVPCMYPLHDKFRGLHFEPEDFHTVRRLFELLRGAEVRIAGASTISGMIVAVDMVPSGTPIPSPSLLDSHGDIATDMTLRVMTDAGLNQVSLADVTSIEFADPELKSALDAGLASFARFGLDDARDLNVSLKGGDKRTVDLSYVTASPIWEITYRLLLEGDTALLQGWAIVENRSGKNWVDIDLVLTSGSPAVIPETNFQSDDLPDDNSVPTTGKSDREVDGGATCILTQSEVDALLSSVEALEPEFTDLEQLDSVSIQSVLRNLENDKLVVALSGAPHTLCDRFLANMSERAAMMVREDIRSVGRLHQVDIDAAQNEVMKLARAMAARGEIVLPDPAPRPEPQPIIFGDVSEPKPQRSNANDEEPETAMQIAIHFTEGVHVPAGNLTALPFIEMQIPIRRTALYRASDRARHPLTAIQVTNSSSTNLPRAVVSLYESDRELGTATFSGEAVIPDIKAGGNGLVGFGYDQKIAVERECRRDHYRRPAEIISGKLRDVVAERETVCYHLHSSALEPRTVVIEHPHRAGWTINEPHSTELNGDHYRLEIELAAGEFRDAVVALETSHTTEIDIASLSESELSGYACADELTQPQHTYFAELTNLMKEKRELEERASQLRYEREDIHAELEMIREHMGFSPSWRTRRRYGGKLAAQEDKFVKVGDERRVIEGRLHEIENAFTTRVGSWVSTE